MKRLDQVTLAVNGELMSNLEFIALSDSSMYLIQLLFVAKKKTHGHQIVVVSKALLLWRKSISHHNIFNTRRAVKKSVTARLFV